MQVQSIEQMDMTTRERIRIGEGIICGVMSSIPGIILVASSIFLMVDGRNSNPSLFVGALGTITGVVILTTGTFFGAFGAARNGMRETAFYVIETIGPFLCLVTMCVCMVARSGNLDAIRVDHNPMTRRRGNELF